MSIWYDYEVERQRRIDEAAQAAAHRESEWQSHVLKATLLPAPRYQRFIVYIGGKLVAWGTQLQQRYATIGAVQDTKASLYPDPLSQT